MISPETFSHLTSTSTRMSRLISSSSKVQRDQRILLVSDMSKKGGKDGGGMDKEKELGKLYKELAALRWGGVCVVAGRKEL